MIKIEDTEVVGWEHAIRGMRNPYESHERSDSGFCSGDKCFYTGECWNQFFKGNEESCPLRIYGADGNPKIMKMEGGFNAYIIGPNDLDLMKRLGNAGTDHRKFMRMIVVYVNVTAPMYWWKQVDQYRIGVTTNSTSTMHKIHAKEFTLEDFSCEHLNDDCVACNVVYEDHSDCLTSLDILKYTIEGLNYWRR